MAASLHAARALGADRAAGQMANLNHNIARENGFSFMNEQAIFKQMAAMAIIYSVMSISARPFLNDVLLKAEKRNHAWHFIIADIFQSTRADMS